MHTMAEDKIDNALGEGMNIMENKSEDWPFTGYSSNHGKSNGGTWYDTTSFG